MTREEVRKTILTMRSMAKLVTLEIPFERSKANNKDLIIKGARENGIDLHLAMDAWLDWLLDIFSVTRYVEETFEDNLRNKEGENPEWYEALGRWFADHRNKGDYFGSIYEEEFQSKGKASILGQYFTPKSIASLCANLTNNNLENLVISDCACGSGRLLTSAYEANHADIDNDTKFHFFVGGDIDNSSVKMCALNLMINGVHGLVINQDALTLRKPRYGYLINPTNFPIRTGMLGVEYLDSDTCCKYVDWQDENGANYNLNKVIQYYRWQWEVAHGKDKKKETKPIQLTLFND